MTLIGYWPLNETEGDTAYDYSGNENHCSLEGSPTQGASGITGNNAYDFDGENDYLDAGNVVSSLSALTVSIWANLDTIGKDERWIGQWGPEGGEERAFLFGPRDEEENRLDFVVGDMDRVTHSSTPVTSSWVHYVAVWDGSQNLGEIYENGVAVASESIDSSIGSSERNLRMGVHSHDYVDGRLAEARIYNRALNPSEIQYLYNVSKRGKFNSRKKKVQKIGQR